MHPTITQPDHPFTRPRRAHGSRDTQNRAARARRTARTRAVTLLEDGYRLDITDAAPGSVHVRKPAPPRPSSEYPAASTLYTVRLLYDHARTRWRYACDCPFFTRHDECKHGRRVLLEFTRALALVRHIRPDNGEGKSVEC